MRIALTLEELKGRAAHYLQQAHADNTRRAYAHDWACSLCAARPDAGSAPVLPTPDPASGARFNPAAAAACTSEIARQECGSVKSPPPTPEACWHVYEGGERKLGESCLVGWECAAPDQANVRANCTATIKGGWQAGECWELREAREGEDCVPTVAHLVECVPPLICSPDSNVCTKRPTLGEACVAGTLGDTCAPGAVCNSASKRCVKPTAVGEPCSRRDECESLACSDGRCREPLFVEPICERATP